jgi:hypothetical protein
MMKTPTEPGKYEGDTYFADGGTQATHVWNNSQWLELGDQTRTHGDESAINDVPAGMEAIPADMPNAAHGDVPLEYNLQNFNALVSANTAMISENNAAQEKIVHLAQVIDDQRERMAEMSHTAKTYEEHAERYSKLAQERKVALDEATTELKFAREEREELRRKLDRMSGYLDRVLDDEDSVRLPETRQVPTIKPAVGPDLDDIPRAVRRTARGDTDMPFAFRGDRIMHSDEIVRRRKY